jgi:RHS repeat-associated protein
LTCTNQPSLTDPYPKGGSTAMCDGSGATSWAHDQMGRVTTEKRLITGASAITNSVGYFYNLDGSMATLTYPSGRVVTYAPNSLGGITAGRSVSAVDSANGINYVTNATYAPQGAIASFKNGASITGIQTYNVRLQPWELYYTNGTPTSATNLQQTTCPSLPAGQQATIMHRAYDFHAATDNGNVYTINNCMVTNRTQNFDYDSLNRIAHAYTTGTSSAATNWGATYTIDPWGNMYNVGPYTGRVNQPPGPSTSATAKNQLLGFGYDIAGNLNTNGSATYVYDAENRITSAVGMTYRYDGNGERVVKCTGTYPSCSSATLYWKGMGSNPLAETNWSGTLNSEYVFFNGKRVARRDANGDVRYHFSDHLGSADVVTFPTGAIQSESDYYPYGGEVVVTAGSGTPNRYKFTGKERDSETGFDYFGARHYYGNIGRFITPDWAAKATTVPYADFGDPQSLNLYGYERNNPVVKPDLDGHGGPCDENEICKGIQQSIMNATGYPAIKKAASAFSGGKATVLGGTTDISGTLHTGHVQTSTTGAQSVTAAPAVGVKVDVVVHPPGEMPGPIAWSLDLPGVSLTGTSNSIGFSVGPEASTSPVNVSVDTGAVSNGASMVKSIVGGSLVDPPTPPTVAPPPSSPPPPGASCENREGCNQSHGTPMADQDKQSTGTSTDQRDSGPKNH